MVKSRYLQSTINSLSLARHKMAFISGPRQCGKTTLAKNMLRQAKDGAYFNWDEKQFRQAWTKHPLGLIQQVLNDHQSNKTPLIVLDEIHKSKGWKQNIKGVYDSIEQDIDIVVTGSAKLNVYRRGSDSLLGRYYHFRLHPFSVKELLAKHPEIHHLNLINTLLKQPKGSPLATAMLDKLWQYGPFPEPLFAEDKRVLTLWQKDRVERLVREDLRDLSRIQELSQIEMLVSLLPDRAAGVLSINALREDLEVAYATMKLWVEYLKQIYYLYELKPYSTSITRSLKKEGKLYLWDWSEIEQPGPRFENLIANHLLKYAHYLSDSGEAKVSLHYLKNRQKQEIDFLLVKDNKPWLPIEVKLADSRPSANWDVYLQQLPCKVGVQVVQTPDVYQHCYLKHGEVIVISAATFLSCLI